MSGTAANLTTRRGATWNVMFSYTDANGVAVDLTAYKARGQVRTADSRAELVMDLSSEGGAPRLVLDGPAGTVELIVSAADTALLSSSVTDARELIYGIEIYDDAVSPEYVEDLVSGRLTVLPEIVR